jgi:hypothetical protein
LRKILLKSTFMKIYKMETLLINIPDSSLAVSIKAYLKTQKGVKFTVFDNNQKSNKLKNEEILAISKNAHAGEEGIDWELAKDIIRTKS